MFRYLSIAITSTVFLIGCNSQTSLKDALEDYHDRLSYVLETPLSEPSFTNASAMPSRSELLEETPALNINVREFFTLPNCSLSTLIAQRNTGLGKTQLPSQRYVYERKLIEALEFCIDVTADTQSRSQLNDFLAQKQAQLPIAYRNMLLASEEVWLSLSQSSGFIEGDSSDGFNQTRAALRLLLDAAPEKSAPIDETALELSLKTLSDFRLIARQWRSQRLISQSFDRSNGQLESQLDTIQCKSPQGEQKAAILRNVFMLFFAEQIQPIASQINYYHYQLTPVLDIFMSQKDLNARWREVVRTNTIDEHQNYRQAMAEHIRIWQAFFKRCNLSPVRT